MGVKQGMMERLGGCDCEEKWMLKEILGMLWISYVFDYDWIIE